MDIKVRPPINVFRALARGGVRMVTQDKRQPVFAGFDAFAAGFKNLLDRARGLAFEVGKGVQLRPEGLNSVLTEAVRMAGELNDDLISFKLELEGPKLRLTPQTWSGREAARLELQGYRATTNALFQMDTALSQGGMTPEEAEKVAAGIIHKHFKASAFKAYDVAADGSVRISHLFTWQEGELVKLYRGDAGLKSHFSDWVPPENYIGEAMFEIVDGGKAFILVNDPGQDERCRRRVGEEDVQFESKPFALIGERNASGRITRVYKVDWETPEELLTYSELAFQGGFARLQDIKQQLILQSETQAMDEIFTIAATEPNVDRALETTSVRIAELFEDDGRGVLADRVTIMLHDPAADLLATRVIWTKKGPQRVFYFAGRGDHGIARKIFDRGGTGPLYLATTTEWREKGVEWLRKGEGSLIANVLAVGPNKYGIIMVSSETPNAFTQDHVRMLGEVSRRVGPAFERIVKGMSTINLDATFGQQFGLNIYNKPYYFARLEAGIQVAKREDQPLSVIYLDFDFFKPLNEAWGNHDEVDHVLAATFRNILAKLREGELYRVGGEEIAIRLNVPLREAEIIANRLREAVDQPITVTINYRERKEAARSMKAIMERLEAGRRAQNKPDDEDHKFWNSGIENVEVVPGRNGEWQLSVTVHKTVSIGVAEYRSGDTGESLNGRAEICQAEAKNTGRNRVVVQTDRT